MSQRYSFPERLRLKSRKQIEKLFEEADSRFSHPLLLKFREIPDEPDFQITDPQIGISVSKRAFKKATDRNLLKRRIREAYRLHWQDHVTSRKLLLMFIYVGKTKLDYGEIEKAVIRILKGLK
ncbi:MAG: ribonuclease P protein component [Saprospiraceae bacterium]|nr:ribonuclease P protein component [Saprospiraceae bacterium]